VLEALNGWIADQSGLIQAQADAQAIQIALNEFNLTATPGIGGSALAGSSMGSAGKGPDGAQPSARPGAAPAGGEGGSSSMSSSPM
jgi:hypothetical protein